MMFSASLEAAPLLQRGATRALAISSAKRSPAFPDLPTVEEAANLPGFGAEFWQCLVVPKGTPKPIIDKLQKVIAKIAAEPEMIERFKLQGVDLRSSTPRGVQGASQQGREALGDPDQGAGHQAGVPS